jgi:hypothetical protein
VQYDGLTGRIVDEPDNGARLAVSRGWHLHFNSQILRRLELLRSAKRQRSVDANRRFELELDQE